MLKKNEYAHQIDPDADSDADADCYGNGKRTNRRRKSIPIAIVTPTQMIRSIAGIAVQN